jgi:hypothetical protein
LTFLAGLGTPKDSQTFAERPVSFSPLIARIKQGSGPFHILVSMSKNLFPLLLTDTGAKQTAMFVPVKYFQAIRKFVSKAQDPVANIKNLFTAVIVAAL